MMKKTIALACCALISYAMMGQETEPTSSPVTTTPAAVPAAPAKKPAQATSQAPSEALQGSYTLRDRFQIMKTKSQSYQNYKVIKESVLDGVWKITQDSINAKQVAINQAKLKIAQLEGDVKKVNDQMQQKEAAVQGVVYDSTHINVAGIDFSKGAFITIAGILIAGLIGGLLFVLARMKVLDRSIREKSLTINMVSSEYDEYKKKAMEKQTKLSRELQDERNRLQEMRRS